MRQEWGVSDRAQCQDTPSCNDLPFHSHSSTAVITIEHYIWIMLPLNWDTGVLSYSYWNGKWIIKCWQLCCMLSKHIHILIICCPLTDYQDIFRWIYQRWRWEADPDDNFTVKKTKTYVSTWCHYVWMLLKLLRDVWNNCTDVTPCEQGVRSCSDHLILFMTHHIMGFITNLLGGASFSSLIYT